MAEPAAQNPQQLQRLAALREAQVRDRRLRQQRSFLGNAVRGVVLATTLAGASGPAAQPREEDEIASTQPGGENYSPTANAREAVRASRLQQSQAQSRGGLFARGRGGTRGGAQTSMIAQYASAAAQAQFKKRDEQNDFVSSKAIANPLAAIPWFNVQLVWGYMVRKGQDKKISPPSWRFLKVPLLPDSSARAAILFVDGLIGLGLLSILIQLLLVIILIYAVTQPGVMSDLVLGILGRVSDFLYGFLPGL